jgi:hypothetical protein
MNTDEMLKKLDKLRDYVEFECSSIGETWQLLIDLAMNHDYFLTTELLPALMAEIDAQLGNITENTEIVDEERWSLEKVRELKWKE